MENKKTHPKMPIEKRAKQFMPFAAVTGLEKALAEKEKEMEKDFRTINRNVHNEEITE